ncbi:hypothetical protein QQX98_013361, partial [Neonectria punicea]
PIPEPPYPSTPEANMDRKAIISPSPRAWFEKVEDTERKDTRVQPWKKIYGTSVDCVFDDIQEIVHVENQGPGGQTIQFRDYDVQANG